jgi:hypothetical protein
MVSFLGIREGTKIKVGDVLLESHFAEVPVPARYADQLKKFVFLYRDKGTVTRIKAIREYAGGDLVHREDYKTPEQEIALKPDERMVWVAVESRAFVPSLVNPGDQITFVFPQPGLGAVEAGVAGAGSASELIGPFRVGALGTRLGDVKVSQAYSAGRSEERQIGIIVRVEGGKLEANALRLLELTAGGNRSVAVALHPREREE